MMFWLGLGIGAVVGLLLGFMLAAFFVAGGEQE